MRICIQRLLLWQGLIERMADRGLSAEEQRGLFGELTTLQSFLLPLIGPDAAVTAWVGPDGANQDFVAGGVGVEVKATIMKMPVRLRISNERQLDETGLAALLLCHVSLVPTLGRGKTLPMIVETLRATLAASPVASREFEVKLVRAGYIHSEREQYDSTGYSISGTDYYHVREGFPRLIGAAIPGGVGDVSYSVAVDMIASYAIDPDQAALIVSQDHG